MKKAKESIDKFLFCLFYLYICSRDLKESNGGANTG